MTASMAHPDPVAPPPVTQGDLAALVALAGLDGIGPATLRAMLVAGEVERAWSQLVSGRAGAVPALAATATSRSRAVGEDGLDGLVRQARTLDPLDLLDQHRRAGIGIITPADPHYPVRLRQDPAPPAVLFVRGHRELVDAAAVAIVGTRNATRLGCDTAGALARALGERGIAVVSGLALGIDGAAHRAVIETARDAPEAGRPIGVVAAGLDVTYPRRHRGLHLEVGKLGVLVSEVPLGTPPTRWRFPARNRIIAALARAVVVVESRSAGGSMLTVSEALARDVPVLAVPGHPSVPNAAGPLDLIAEGAAPVRDVDDVLVAIGRGGLEAITHPEPDETSARTCLDDVARSVLAGLQARPRTLGQLVGSQHGPLDVVAGALTSLEERGLVARSGPWFETTAAGIAHRGVQP